MKLKLIFDGPYKRRNSSGVLNTEYRYRIDISTPEGKKAFAEYKKAKESAGYTVWGTEKEPLVGTLRYFGQTAEVDFTSKGNVYVADNLSDADLDARQKAKDARDEEFNENLARVNQAGIKDEVARAIALFGKR
jgi:hypothetical protein